MTNDEFRVLAAETGPLDDDITGVAQVADTRWVIAYGEAEVDLELTEEGRRVVVTAPIGIVPEGRLGEIAPKLLAYTALWRTTGGVRAALPASNEPALLIVDLLTEEVTPKGLAAAARDMAEKAAVWRGLLAAPAGAAPAEADPFSTATMIRV